MLLFNYKILHIIYICIYIYIHAYIELTQFNSSALDIKRKKIQTQCKKIIIIIIIIIIIECNQFEHGGVI